MQIKNYTYFEVWAYDEISLRMKIHLNQIHEQKWSNEYSFLEYFQLDERQIANQSTFLLYCSLQSTKKLVCLCACIEI